MSRMRAILHRALAYTLTVCLLLGLASVSTGAANDPYFLVVNDHLPDSSVYTTPIYVDGLTYVPCTVFSSQYTGVALGVTYEWSQGDDVVSLYSRSANVMLDFNLSTGQVTDYPGRNEYNYPAAVMRNGLPYVPAAKVCSFFGMSASFLEPDGCHVLRIKNGNEVFNDTAYLQSARPELDTWIARYNAENPGSGSGTHSTPAEDPSETENPGQSSSIFLAIRMDTGGSVAGMLQSLRHRSGKAIFFFRVDQLTDHVDEIIDIINQGSRVGLIPNGEDAVSQHASVQNGAEILSALLLQRAFFVLADGLHEDAAATLGAEGYILWSQRLTIEAAGRGGGQIYNDTLEQIHALKGVMRLLIDDNVPAGTLSSILRQLREDSYALRAPRETFY